jgi:uncharacterized protein (TIGR02444 family)
MQDSTAFWQFSVALYAAPGVSHACIQLQDQWQANVNLMLWLVWLEQRNQSVEGDVITQAEAAIAPWHTQTLQPLRELRRHLGSQRSTPNHDNSCPVKDELYQQLKAAELLAEKIQQRTLVELSSQLSFSPAERPGRNLGRYFDHLQIPEVERGDLLACLYAPVNVDD